jgi:hypothetical protein
MLLKRDLSGKDIRNVPQTSMLADQQAHTRKGIDALIEWILTEGALPCAHPTRPHIAITTHDPTLRQDSLYDVATRRFPSLKYQTPASVVRSLKDDWGCTSWRGSKQRGLMFLPPPELRQKFLAKHGGVNLPDDIKEWE